MKRTVWTTGEAAKLFQVSSQTIINWIGEGKLEAHRIGKGPRTLNSKALSNFIEAIQIPVENLHNDLYRKLLTQLNTTPTTIVFTEEEVAHLSEVLTNYNQSRYPFPHESSAMNKINNALNGINNEKVRNTL